MADEEAREDFVDGGGNQKIRLGDEVEIFWPLDQAWYGGCVTELDKEGGKGK